MKDRKTTILRLDRDLHKQMRQIALEDDRSMNAAMIVALKQYIANRKSK